jgi:nucleotide-binding universal stress UspA family protein
MSEAEEATRSQRYTSPTPAAPVLIGVDGDEGGRDALALGRVIASIRGSDCVAAVAEEGSTREEVRAALGESARTAVIGWRDPPQALVESAEREKAGTLVLGSTRLGRVGRALLGDVGGHALNHAPCEVAVAPRGYAERPQEGVTKIAVAVDGSEESKVALTRAEDLAREAGATIEVLVAEDPGVRDIEALYGTDAPRSLAGVLEAAVGSVDPSLRPSGKRVETGWRQIARTIAVALAEACAEDVGLIVAGCRRPLAHFLEGSVTEHLIEEAPCPVLVVPHSRRG